jgi:RHS repeat-associated protein
VLGGTSYDNDGNLLNDTFAKYTWDASNRPVTIVSGSNNLSFTYDAFDRMVDRTNGTASREVLYGPTGYLGTMNGQTENAIKFPLPGGVVYDVYQKAFFHKDWLKSTRLSTTLSGRALSQSTAYAPFGEPYALTGSTFDFTGDPIDFLKATYDTSGGGGFEDTPNRELRVNQGRWISPDPVGLMAVDPASPQTWNRYAYVANNPMSAVDPTGLLLMDCAWDGCPHNNAGGYYGGSAEGIYVNGIQQTVFNMSGLGSNDIDGIVPPGCGGGVCFINGILVQRKNGKFGGCGGSGYSYFCLEFAAANNGSWLQQGLNYLKTHPVFISFNEIVALQLTVKWSTKTVCGNWGAGASVPPTKMVTVGVYNEGNMSNWTNVLSSWGYSFGANLGLGYQASTNSSGTIGGPSVSGVGLSGSYTFGACGGPEAN